MILVHIKKVLEEVSGADFTSVFNDIVYDSQDFSSYLKDAFEVFGWSYTKIPSKKSSWNYGLKTVANNNGVKVISILENSAAFKSGLVEKDKLIAINSNVINNDLDEWMGYFKNENIQFTIERRGG